MMKPLALDLCCGKGGWTIGLLAAGWDVIGVDVEAWEGYPGVFAKCDVREFKLSDWTPRKVSLVVASPPCQDFSYSSFPFKKAREKFSEENPPDQSIWRACERIAKELNAPLILENVRGARKWMGRETFHYGSFYFWGELPALLPIGNPKKGFRRVNKTSGNAPTGGFACDPHGKKQWRGNSPAKGFAGEYERVTGLRKKDNFHADGERGKKKWEGMEHGKMSSQSKGRKEWSAKAAMIPYELAHWIGTCFYPRDLK